MDNLSTVGNSHKGAATGAAAYATLAVAIVPWIVNATISARVATRKALNKRFFFILVSFAEVGIGWLASVVEHTVAFWPSPKLTKFTKIHQKKSFSI
jgi:hypothetical protein